MALLTKTPMLRLIALPVAKISGSRARAGPFPIRIARAGDLGPNEDSPLAGTWQVAFLGEIEPRAARPGIAAPASETSRPSHSPGCQIAPVASAELRRGILEHFRPNEIASLRPAG